MRHDNLILQFARHERFYEQRAIKRRRWFLTLQLLRRNVYLAFVRARNGRSHSIHIQANHSAF